MESAEDVREVPVTRRAKVTPEQVGLPSGVRRRVAGLRREEAAMLAGAVRLPAGDPGTIEPRGHHR